MLKKVFLPLISAVLAAVLISGSALAAADGPTPIRVRGRVTAVDAAAGKFRLETPDGETVTFFVDENTRYRGQLESLDDMQEGWLAGVGAVERDGKLWARLVIAGERPERPEQGAFPPPPPDPGGARPGSPGFFSG